MKKKILACLLAAMMILTLLPLTAFAADEDVIDEISFTVTLPPIAGDETTVELYTYEPDDGPSYQEYEQSNTPDIDFYYDQIFDADADSDYAYVVAGADSYDCPFENDGYTFFEGTFEKNQEYIAAIKLTLDPESSYKFSDSLKITVNDDAYYVKSYEVSPNNDDSTVTIYFTLIADTANNLLIVYYPEDDDDYTYSMTVPSGQPTTEPAEPDRDGYVFTGWFSDKARTKPFEFGNLLTKDTYIYAGWEEAELITEAELNFTAPMIGDEVKFVPTEIEFYPGYTETVDFPDRFPEITVNGKKCEVADAYYLTGIPADPEAGPAEDEYFEGKFEAGKLYGVELTLSSDTAVFAANEDLNISIPGAEEIVLDPGNSFGRDFIHIYFSFKPNAEIYKVIEGANQKVPADNSKDVIFRIDAPYSLFKDGGKVFIDDKAASGFTSYEGSTVIAFPAKYINSLGPGEHTLKVVFSDGGEATTTFTVEEPETIAPTDYPTDTTLPLAFYPASIAALCGAAYVLSRKEKEMA